MKIVETELHSNVTLTLGGLSDQPHSSATFFPGEGVPATH